MNNTKMPCLDGALPEVADVPAPAAAPDQSGLCGAVSGPAPLGTNELGRTRRACGLGADDALSLAGRVAGVHPPCPGGRAGPVKRVGRTTGAAQARGCAPGETVAAERHERKETGMIRRTFLLAWMSVLLPVGLAQAQESYPIMETVAQNVIEKYQTSSCQQLAQQKTQPPTGQRAQMEQRAIQLLRNDPQMRTAFLNRVAAPIANKLFECGMIP